MFFKLAAFFFIIPGIITVFSARWIVGKFRFDEKMLCEYENELTEDEISSYKNTKAVVSIKMVGMLMLLPGFIIAIIAFR